VFDSTGGALAGVGGALFITGVAILISRGQHARVQVVTGAAR
jgi:hypothetical protein